MDTTRKTCFGVCSVNGHELTNHAGRVELNFVEPLKPFSANSSQIDQVARLVPGRVVMFVEVFDAPFGAQSPEHADTTRLQLSILDLDMTGCKSSLVKSRPFKNLIQPYAVVRWHGRKVGREEIMRPSLNPLFCSPLQNAHRINRYGLPPQGTQLCFGGQPYIFRLTPANRSALNRYAPIDYKIGVTLDLYSTAVDMLGSQAHLDLFLGQAVLESPMAKISHGSYCTLPLRRRREDTLNASFLKFCLSRVARRLLI